MVGLFQLTRVLLVFCILVFLTVLLNGGIAILAFQKKDERGNAIGVMSILSIVVSVSYLISIIEDNHTVMMLCSGIYFASITVLLLYVLKFIVYFSGWQNKKVILGIRVAVTITVILDAVVEIVNTIPGSFIYEKAISYDPVVNGNYLSYQWVMHPLYHMHLWITYALVALALVFLVIRLFQLPTGYRKQCSYIILSIILVIFVNAIFLLVKNKISNILDYSVLGYCICILIFFWATYEFTKQGMLKQFKFTIMENIDQGIALFDYENRLVLQNDKMKFLFPSVHLDDDTPLEVFIEKCEISPDCETLRENLSFQCYVKHGFGMRPIRCDYKPLINKKAEVTGRMFVFTDSVFDTDLITGFHSLESYEIYLKEKNLDASKDTVVAIVDINGLGYMNSAYGRNYGDQCISQLAGTMRKIFPNTTYFVRGNEANLIAICVRSSEQEVSVYLEQLTGEYNQKIQYAMATVDSEKPSIIASIVVATRGLNTKKLMDKESNHSELLNSLIRALQECDSDTEAHVQRTQMMGAKLGERIGLSDAQQSDLSLLCLLHDIGKIGVPLDILNKPGKLSEHEWKVVQSHVEKGYQIANSSQELQGIADMILHHHERWDGNGYPDGLRRESIPILCRVISVVDAYDAMINNRSYRAAMSREKAVSELRTCAGKQFDPTIVSEFLALLNEIDYPDSVPENNPWTERVVANEPGAEGSVENQHIHVINYSRYVISSDMDIVEIDEMFEELTGYSKEDVESKKMTQADLLPEEDRTDYLCMTTEQLTNRDTAYFEHRIRRKNGTILNVFCFGRRFYDSSHREERSEIIITDSEATYMMRKLSNTEQQKEQLRLKRWESKYRQDPLTSLMTQEAFRNDVEERLLTDSIKIMFLMMDVDKFKQYNDTYGHLAGDEYLIDIAQALQMALRKEDLACRMGGDEFAAALFFKTDTEETLMINRAEQVFEKVSHVVGQNAVGATVSMGVSVGVGSELTFNQLYEKADQSLYASKSSGRACMTVYKEKTKE